MSFSGYLLLFFSKVVFKISLKKPHQIYISIRSGFYRDFKTPLSEKEDQTYKIRTYFLALNSALCRSGNLSEILKKRASESC